MAQNERSPKKQVASGIEQIREIIFGDQIEQYNRQFEMLHKQYQELQHRIELLEQKQTEHDQRLAQGMEQQRATQADQQQTRAVIEGLKQELEQKIAQLDQNKVDKSQIGQAFIEWGMKVKQTGITQS